MTKRKPTEQGPQDSKDITIMELQQKNEDLQNKIKDNEQERLKKENENLKSANTALKKQLSELQNLPVAKGKIHKFLTDILGTEISDKVLVDIKFNEDKEYENQLTILGRPSVLGSSTKQMRHITPYSFVKHIIKSKIDNAKSKIDALQDLQEPLRIFASEQEGICLIDTDYEKFKCDIKAKKDFYYLKANTTKTISEQGITSTVYYLINDTKKLDKWNKDASANKKIQAQEDYHIKLQKFINHAMSNLEEAIKDNNTLTIACEATARFILTLFNQRLYTAFPEEGNTLTYEIRYEPTSLDVQQSSPLLPVPLTPEYTVLTHAAVVKKSVEQESLDKKIRIVTNEGNIVKKVIKALETLEHIIADINTIGNAKDTDIKDYQNKYDGKLEIPTPLDATLVNEFIKHNQQITKTNIRSLCHYHIAKHLYFVFDFKPLEEQVFVSAQKSDIDNNTLQKVKVFPSADGTRSATYCIKDGMTYRADQVNNAKGYNKEVIFRSEIPDKEFRPLLTKKVLDHVYISIMSFFSFKEGFSNNENYPKSILQAFSKLVATDYKIPQDTFVSDVNNMCKNMKVFQDSIDNSLNTSSEVESIGNMYNNDLGLV